jgi:uncharacterized membrane protein
MNMVKRFVIYGLTGFCVEVIWTGLFSMLSGDIKLTGQTYIWMFPIYGLAIFLEPIHNKVRHFPLIIRGGIYTILIFAAEFATGMLLKGILGVCPWDYTSKPLQIYGVITLVYAPAWFVAGLLFEKLHDTLILIQQSLSRQKGLIKP